MIYLDRTRTDKNNHSDIDGIGALRLSLPKDLCRRLTSIPEFDWVFESNEAIEKFANLNPQFDARYRASITEMPTFIINKDGGMWDIKTMTFKGVKRC